MKQSKIIIISILCGIFLLLGGVLIWGITGFNIRTNNREHNMSQSVFKDYRKVLEVEVPAERIESLSLLFGKNSNDIYFYHNDSEQIFIEEYVNWELSEKEETKVTEENGVLTLDSPKRDNGIVNFGINNRNGYVNVYLPESYKGNMKITTISGDIDSEMDLVLGDRAEFKASSTSGDIMLLKVESKTVDISSVSGDVDADTIISKTDISTTSGDIDVNVITGDCKASTVSGDITINYVTGKAGFSATSGDIRADEISGACNVNTVSGDVWLGFSQLKGDVDVSTTSGVVNINIASSAIINFAASTTSGNIDTFFDDYLSFNKKGNHASGTYGAGDADNVGISTVSGDIRISQKQ